MVDCAQIYFLIKLLLSNLLARLHLNRFYPLYFLIERVNKLLDYNEHLLRALLCILATY